MKSRPQKKLRKNKTVAKKGDNLKMKETANNLKYCGEIK